MYEVSSYFKVNFTRALDRCVPAEYVYHSVVASNGFAVPHNALPCSRLITFVTNSSWPAYNILHNISMGFDGEVGDHIGLFPSEWEATPPLSMPSNRICCASPPCSCLLGAGAVLQHLPAECGMDDSSGDSCKVRLPQTRHTP
jgi:hypothetical protein